MRFNSELVLLSSEFALFENADMSSNPNRPQPPLNDNKPVLSVPKPVLAAVGSAIKTAETQSKQGLQAIGSIGSQNSTPAFSSGNEAMLPACNQTCASVDSTIKNTEVANPLPILPIPTSPPVDREDSQDCQYESELPKLGNTGGRETAKNANLLPKLRRVWRQVAVNANTIHRLRGTTFN